MKKTDTNEVSRKHATYLSFGTLSQKKIDEIDNAVKECRYGKVQMAYFIYRLLMKQSRRKFHGELHNKHAVLLNLREGRIMGSNRCPRCDGYLGANYEE